MNQRLISSPPHASFDATDRGTTRTANSSGTPRPARRIKLCENDLSRKGRKISFRFHGGTDFQRRIQFGEFNQQPFQFLEIFLPRHVEFAFSQLQH